MISWFYSKYYDHISFVKTLFQDNSEKNEVTFDLENNSMFA
jgi:hypothetical protein